MTKIIHCIKVGPNSELGDFELCCIDTWKKVYPDFEIKYWTDKEILPLLSDCKYAISCYNNGRFAFAGDYARLKILYEYGGLYMDTDVFCVNRIPDEFFERNFTSWDAGFDTYWTQNGTCLYAAEPKSKLFKTFKGYYQTFKEYPEFSADNTVIEAVIRGLGIDFSNRMNCQLTNQRLEDLDVYNCAQFGAFDYTQNLLWNLPKEFPVYLVHSRTKSWSGYLAENVYLYYALVDEKTDMNQLYEMVRKFGNMKLNNPKCQPVLVLGLNCLNSDVNWLSRWLNLRRLAYLVVPLGVNLTDDELNAAFLDFVTKRFNKIKFCRDIMDGSFTGELTV